MSAPIPEVRVSQSGHHVAARDGSTGEWRATNGFTCTDEQVADWTPLVPATEITDELERILGAPAGSTIVEYALAVGERAAARLRELRGGAA